LQWRSPVFGSPGDEKAFFGWLESISGVSRVEGKDQGLIVHFRSRRISERALRELIAISQRYGVDMSQLAQFLTPKNDHWFKARAKYWYKAVFS
jgi:hypothetical protein